MTERIDFALEPGVVLFAVLFFVLVNVFLAAVIYPYLQGSTSDGDGAGQRASTEGRDFIEVDPSSQKPLEDRVDEFLEDFEKQKTG